MAVEVTLSTPLTHRCPYRDERDVGHLWFSYSTEHGEIELYRFAELVAAYDREAITHESLTEDLAMLFAPFHPSVVTEWMTAGVVVTCRAVPDLDLQPSD